MTTKHRKYHKSLGEPNTTVHHLYVIWVIIFNLEKLVFIFSIKFMQRVAVQSFIEISSANLANKRKNFLWEIDLSMNESKYNVTETGNMKNNQQIKYNISVYSIIFFLINVESEKSL